MKLLTFILATFILFLAVKPGVDSISLQTDTEQTCCGGQCTPTSDSDNSQDQNQDNDCDGKIDESPCTASKFCSTILIKNSWDYTNRLKCYMADWMENEINPYPGDCKVQFKSNKTSKTVSCIATTYAN